MHLPEKLALASGSDVPTEPAPDQAAAAAAAKAATPADPQTFCDSEAPTGVATERPLLPRPPRAPQV